MQNIVYKDSTNGEGYYEFNKMLQKGKYFIRFFTTPEIYSWYYPYAFKLTHTQTLPLTLVDFLASLDENKTILKWTTSNEINTSKFDIERSFNSTDWYFLGNKDATNLIGTNNYAFIDASPIYGVNYYRLKMIDKDGEYTYSPIRKVEIIKPNTTFIIAPNPAKSTTAICFNAPISTAEIIVYDAQGRQVYTIKYNGAPTKNFELNTSTFLNGVYIVNVKISDRNYNERLIISK